MPITDRSQIGTRFLNNVFFAYCKLPNILDIDNLLDNALIEKDNLNITTGTAAAEMLLEDIVTRDKFTKLTDAGQARTTALVVYWLKMMYCISFTIYETLTNFKIIDKDKKEFIFTMTPNTKLKIQLGDPITDNYYTRAVITWDVKDANGNFLGNAYMTIGIYPPGELCRHAIKFASRLTSLDDFFTFTPKIEIGLVSEKDLYKSTNGFWNCDRFDINNITKAEIEKNLSSSWVSLNNGTNRLI